MGGPKRKVGGPKKKIFRRFAPKMGPPTFNLLPTPLRMVIHDHHHGWDDKPRRPKCAGKWLSTNARRCQRLSHTYLSYNTVANVTVLLLHLYRAVHRSSQRCIRCTSTRHPRAEKNWGGGANLQDKVVSAPPPGRSRVYF